MNNTEIINWNKNIPYYELPLIIESNLPNPTLEWINNEYNFLIYKLPIFNIFYINNGSIEYKNYSALTKYFYNLKEGLDQIINKYNVVRDKKICFIIAITKKSNYYVIRYGYIDTENVVLKCDKELKGFIRKEKISLLLNNNEKKTFKKDINLINDNDILTEEIRSSHI